jgi:hypothetical protein
MCNLRRLRACRRSLLWRNLIALLDTRLIRFPLTFQNHVTNARRRCLRLRLGFHATAASKIQRSPQFAEIDGVGERTKKAEQPQLALKMVQGRSPGRENAQGIGRADGGVAQYFESRSVAEQLAGDDQVELGLIQQRDASGFGRGCLDGQVIRKHAGSSCQRLGFSTCNEYPHTH